AEEQEHRSVDNNDVHSSTSGVCFASWLNRMNRLTIRMIGLIKKYAMAHAMSPLAMAKWMGGNSMTTRFSNSRLIPRRRLGGADFLTGIFIRTPPCTRCPK